MALSLKVFLVSTGQMKTMRLMQDMSISEVCQEVKEKYKIGGPDHGIFQPEVAGKVSGRWLRMDRTLQYYDLNTGTEIHYKKKHRPLKVRLLDDTVKTILVDESLTVNEIAEIIGKKIGIGCPEEFSLKIEGSGEREWLTPTLSLHENGVNDDMVLVLKKKFFFNDANVDRSDPVQLHLLYVQCRDSVLDGTHPTQRDEAVQLAAIQAQIELGPFDPEKHKPTALKLNTLLPLQWQKDKKIASSISKEHRKLSSMESENAKYRYTQLCRALPTFGITSFLVHERIDRGPKKNPKMIPMLLGVTRDSIVIMDVETKKVKRTFPITHLQRWAPGVRTFTLDFGEHENDYLTVQTLEGEAISQLIAGYIDIILKRTKNAPRLSAQEDTKVAKIVDVAPIQAQATSFTTAPTLVGQHNPQQVVESYIDPGLRMPAVAQQVSQPYTIDDAIQRVQGSLAQLAIPTESGFVPDDFNPQYVREEFITQSRGVLVRAAQLAQNITSGNINIDQTSVDICSDIAAMIESARGLASCSEQDASMIPRAFAVSEAIKGVLHCAKILRDNPSDKYAQMAMKVAQAQLQTAQLSIQAAQRGAIVPKELSDLVLVSGNIVAEAIKQLNEQTIEYSQGNPALTAVASYTNQLGDGLLYSVRTLATMLSSPECMQQVSVLSNSFSKACASLLQTFSNHLDSVAMGRISLSVGDINRAIDNLRQAAKSIAENPIDNLYNASLLLSQASPILLSPQSDSQDLINGYKNIAKASAAIVNNAKTIIESHPASFQAQVLSPAKELATTTRSLFTSVKTASKNPTDRNCRLEIANGIKRILASTSEIKSQLAIELAAAGLKHKAILLASGGSELALVSDRVFVADSTLQENLKKASLEAKQGIIKLIESIAEISQNPRDQQNFAELISASKSAAHPVSQLVAVGKQSTRKIDDSQQRNDLTNSCKGVSGAIQALMQAINDVEEIGGGKEIKEGLEEFENMVADLEAQLIAADGGFLVAVPGQTFPEAMDLLGFSVNSLRNILEKLARVTSKEPSLVGQTVSECTAQVSQVIEAAKAVATLTRGKEGQKNVVSAAINMTKNYKQLFTDTKNFVIDPDNLELAEPLQQSQKDADLSCVNLMNAARGINTSDISKASETISKAAQQFTIGQATGFSVGVAELKKHVTRITATASQIVSAAMTNPKGLGLACKMAADATPNFVQAVNKAAGLFSDRDSGESILDRARVVTENVVELINQALGAAAQDNPNSANLRRTNLQLINQLKDLLNSVKPGQAEITDAVNTISNSINILDSDDPLVIGAMPLWQLQQSIKQLAGASSNITSSSRNQNPRIGNYSKEASSCVAQIINASRLLINPSENPCTVVASKIHSSANLLAHAPNDTAKVIGITKTIATLTKEAISAAKDYRGEPSQRQNIMRCSQLLGGATSELGKATKALVSNQPDAANQVIRAGELLKAKANEFRELSLSKDKSPISTELQQNLFDSVRSVATSTSHLISAASSVYDDPVDISLDSELSSAVNSLGDNLSNLQKISISLAPGADESTSALKTLQSALAELDTVSISLAAGVDLSDKKPNQSVQTIHTELVSTLRGMASEVQNLVKHTSENPEKVAHSFKNLESICAAAGVNGLNVVYSTKDQRVQSNQLDKVKNLFQTTVRFVQSTKQANVNPADGELMSNMTNLAQEVKDAITYLGGELQGEMIVLQECDAALKVLQNSLNTLNVPAQRQATTTYQDCQKDIRTQTRSLANALSNLMTTSNKNPDQIGVAAKELSDIISQLIDSTRLAAVVTRIPEVQKQLLTAVMNVTRGTANMIKNAKSIAENPNDQRPLTEISKGLNHVTNAVSELSIALKNGATTEREIEQAIENIAKIKTDLDSAALLAASGQFTAQVSEGHSVEDSVESLKKSLQEVSSNAVSLIDASKGYQEQFSTAVQSTVKAIDKCTTFARETASLLPDLLSQQSILTGARAVTIAVEQMVLTGKDAQANPLDTKAQEVLQNSVEGVSLATEQLINLTESSSADLIITIKKLQKAIRDIRQTFKQYSDSSFTGESGTTPINIFQTVKLLVRGNGKLLTSYGSSQAEFLDAIGEVHSKGIELIHRAKAGRLLVNDQSIHVQLDSTLKNVVQGLISFLETGKLQRIDDPSYYKKFSDDSENCTSKLNDFISIVKLLPGGKELDLDDDEQNTAENELQAAIAAIEAAKAKLLDPSQWQHIEGSFDLGDVAVQIIDATKSIASATQFLVQTATQVQNEIVAQGRATSKKTGQVYRKDPAWEEGLISAAKAVAGTTEDLVTFANQSVRGECGEEMLVACVRGVGGATARLVAAAKAKADPFSNSHQALGTGAKRVAEATQELANATKAATEKKVEDQMKQRAATSTSFAGLRAQELEEQARIAKLELELERARQNLFQKRKKEYRS